MSTGGFSCGMFGIKLAGDAQRAFRFLGKDGKPPLLNFPDNPEGRRVATGIPIGHKSLVYLMQPVMRTWAAIEYIKWDVSISDVLEEGTRGAIAQNAIAMMEAYNAKFAKVWRCIRFLAVIDDLTKSPPP